MSSEMLSYIDKDSPIHRLSGATKLIVFLLFSIATMITYDTRILIGLLAFGLISFKASKIEFKEVSLIFYFIIGFLLINAVIIFLFSPYEGVEIYGSRTDIIKLFGPYTLTWEQLFYQFNVLLKYFATTPLALLFILTIEPSEFAASLNKLGVSYRTSYSVSIALRYIPDIQRDYKNISLAQQARGLDLSRNEKFTKRVKNSASILMPLIFSSLERIEKISLAMELRAFGNKNNRTWYNAKKFAINDFMAIGLLVIIVGISIYFLGVNGSRFYNPFI